MNNLPAELKNRYVAMRHGTSEANHEGIIVSHPDRGVPAYRLTEEGKNKVRESVAQAREERILDAQTLIVASDFARTAETAEIAADILGVPHTTLTPKLRERFFGVFEGTSDHNYEIVWTSDRHDPAHKKNDVESVAEVLDRATSLITDLETQYADKTILLVSHGDTLQILQTAFQKVHPGTHRSLVHLEPAEIRVLH